MNDVINMVNGKAVKVKEDWWRRGIMKKIPLLISLSSLMIVGVMLTICLK